MTRFRPLALGLALLTPVPASADEGAARAFPATLAGHALLPAMSFIPAPADAPALFHSSGNPKAPRPTGVALPFAGQPLQGFSGIKRLGDGEFLALLDNGFGNQVNSVDAMLTFHRIRPDWESGKVRVIESAFLHDPDRKVPFRIVAEATATRYLTGSDLDIESIQPIGDAVWFGDEFGPYLISADRRGRVTGVYETMVDGKQIRSPDHYHVGAPATPGAVSFEARRSRGYEGMAASPDGRFLYPLMEGPLWDEQAKAWETKDGREYLRILEFDVAKKTWTGRNWKYLLEANGNNIGDFNMIDAGTGLIIERDNGEGAPEQACQGEAKPDCFNVPARFKRIYKVDLAGADAQGFVRKIGYIDLMNVADPQGKARTGTVKGKFTFPFVTIEDVDVADEGHIIVANDNNLPYSTGRQLGRQDDNEFILLETREFLAAR